MSGIYYGLIIFPMLFMGTLSFMYQSSLDSISVQQLRMNCPLPLNGGDITSLSITDDNNVEYTPVWDNSTSDYHLTVFKCGEGGTVNVYDITYTNANNWWDSVVNNLGYLYHMFTTIGDRISGFMTMIWLYIDAPAQVSGLSFFTYINGIMVGLVALGGFLAIRGG